MSRSNSARHAPASEPTPKVSPDDASAPLSVRRDMSWLGHFAWLRSKLRARLQADLADDLAQETYLRIVGRDARSEVDNPRGLLMSVATNLARDALRRERVRSEFAARTAGRSVPGGADQHTVEDDLLVREAILSLPPKLRDVLLLSKIGGLTNREIAQRYGLTVRAIDKRLQKAVTLFVARLRD